MLVLVITFQRINSYFLHCESLFPKIHASCMNTAVPKFHNYNTVLCLCSGYWHGSVAVHARYSSSDETHHSILADVSTLSNIRHESIQLFLGVCHDLHSDYISIIME